MTTINKNEATVSLAFEIHKPRAVRAKARYISRFSDHGFCSEEEARRILTFAKTPAEFMHMHETMEFWQDCHNDCEVA